MLVMVVINMTRQYFFVQRICRNAVQLIIISLVFLFSSSVVLSKTCILNFMSDLCTVGIVGTLSGNLERRL